MFEEAISLLSIWASMNSWLTPTVLFLLLNLMIGTIAVTSGFTSHKPSHQHHHHHHPHHHHHHHHHNQHLEPTFHHHQPPLQPQLFRSPSILQRLKSINLYTFYTPPPTTHLQPPLLQPDPTPETHFPTTTTGASTAAEEDESPTLDEIYRKIKQENSISPYNRQNSDTKPSGGELPVKLPKKMKKSASDKSAFNHFHLQEEDTENIEVAADHSAVTTVDEVELGEGTRNAPPLLSREEREDEGVDAKADDFINKFKKQLQMQK